METSSAGHPVLLGRERVLALVAEHLSSGTPCVLVGESGIGKSTLAAAIAAAEPRAFVGGGLATLSWMAYLPLRRAFGVEPHGDAAAVADDVAARVGDGLLVIDDLQWVDAATRQALELLGGRLRLLLAVRSDDAGANEALELCDALGAVRVEPEPLERDDALALVRAVRADLAGPLALQLVERAGGNPLFLRELAAAGDVSASFRLALAARIRSLSPAARDSLALLALLGRPAEQALLGDGVDDLVERDFADESDGLVAIRHALFAEAAIAELDDPAPLHAQLAEHVQGRAEAAHHFAAAGMPDRAAALALAAAEEAATQPERAELLALAARCERSTDLALRAARELEACGLYGAAERTVELVFPLTGRDRAQAACVLWNIRYELGDLEGAASEVAVGLAEAGDDERLRAELTLADANVALFDERMRSERLRKTEAALALVHDDDELRAWARRLYGTALYLAADRDSSVDELVRAADESRSNNDIDGELRSLYNAIAAAESFSQHDRARTLALTGIERAREFRLTTRERELRVTLVNLDTHGGRYDAVVRDGTALLAEGLDARRRDTVLVLLAVALIDTGRFAEASVYVEQLLTRGAADIRGHGMGQWLRAEAELWGGDARAALATIDRFLARDDVGQWEAFGRAVQAWARHELGLPVEPWARATLTPILAGFGHELDALEALSRGDRDGAASEFRAGAESFAASHVRGELRCLLGEALAREDVELLLALESRAEEHGLAPLLARVQRALRLLGVRRSAPRGESRAGLTARESEVLELAGAGLTNEAIARRLGIGHSTVKRLVASGARKLGADTRAQAVARFART